jgi:hypothetical protein
MLVFESKCSARGALSTRRRPVAGSVARGLVPAEELEHLTDGAFLTRGFRQRQVVLHRVAIATPVPFLDHITRVGEVGDHSEDGALGDPERRRDVAETYTGVARDAQQHPGVIRQEAPLGHSWILV